VLICKGAPEAILAVCDRRRDGSASVHLDNEARDTITAKLKSLAAQGLRAVAVATKTCATPGDALAPSDEADLIFEKASAA
jgi:Mg2+-importing ATPase